MTHASKRIVQNRCTGGRGRTGRKRFQHRAGEDDESAARVLRHRQKDHRCQRRVLLPSMRPEHPVVPAGMVSERPMDAGHQLLRASLLGEVRRPLGWIEAAAEGVSGWACRRRRERVTAPLT